MVSALYCPNTLQKSISPHICCCERIVYRHGTIFLIVRVAVISTLGGDDIEDGVPDREQVDSEREKVEEGEKQERDKHEETSNGRSNM